MEDEKILKENIVFNVLRTIVSILYPVVTFAYVARVVSVESLGGVTFAKNFVSYFCLLASLGVSFYGTREGARTIRDKRQFSKLFYEILIINIISTVISLILFLIIFLFVPSLEKYKLLLSINAISIVLSGLSNEWVLGAVEKYKFISIRNMIMQLLCVIAILIFVKNEEDYVIYSILLVISGYGTNIFNWVYIQKTELIGKIELCEIEIKKHIKPILILFAMLVSIDLYTLLDTTMLGLMQGERAVGLYSAAIKVPRLANAMIASVGTVLVPRLSYYYEKDKKKFEIMIRKAMTFVFMISIPLAFGILGMSEEIILIVCGEKYIDSILTLRILAVITMIIPISVLFNNQIFIPMRKEILVLKSTCVGATVNIIANILLIPIFAENGAALGTVFAELTVMCICVYHVKKELKIQGMIKEYIKRFGVALTIVPVMISSKIFIKNNLMCLAIAIMLCGIMFGVFSFTTIRRLIRKETSYEKSSIN